MANSEEEVHRSRAVAETELDNFRSSVGLELVSLKTSSGDVGK